MSVGEIIGLVLVLLSAMGIRESGLIIKPGRHYQESWTASIYTLLISIIALLLGISLLFGWII